jgi:hypothetical protein
MGSAPGEEQAFYFERIGARRPIAELHIQSVELIARHCGRRVQVEIIESLNAELGQINDKLAALDQIKNDRATLTAQKSRLTKAIAMLSGEPVVRKPMSPEAKERIRVGLEKARAAKLAATSAIAQPAAAQPLPVSQQPAAVEKKASTPDKGSGRGAK